MGSMKKSDIPYSVRHKESNQRLKDKRRQQLAEIKMARGCVDCGYNAAPEALHFDHRDPTLKEFTISNRLFAAWEKTLLEIAKCDVRCANCHAIRSKRLGHHTR